jgi:hypothetical protein
MASDQSKNSFWEYLKAFGQDWSTRMSGPLSVPLAFVAVFVSGWTRVGLLLLSAACLIFASFKIWKNQQKEIAKLKVRPYEESQRQLVQGMLAPLGPDERAALRYFVQHGEREQQQIFIDLNLNQPHFTGAFDSVARSGLLDREERPKAGRAGLDLFWWVNPQFIEILKDELFQKGEDSSRPQGSAHPELRQTKLILNLKRFLVVFGTIATLYFAIGSYFFPEWYFGLFWGGKLWDRAWWKDAVSYWLDLHTGLLIAVIIVVFVVALLVYAFRRFFLPFIDRFAIRLALCLGVAISVTALLDHIYAKTSFENLERLEAAMSNLNSVIQQSVSFEVAEQSDLEAPIDFQYIHRPRVEALYSQLEPELVEKHRTVSAGESKSGKGSIVIGPAGGEIGGSKQEAATSSFERANFSPERKCLEIMKFVLGQKTAHFYTTGGEWFGRKLLQTFREDMTTAFKKAESSDGGEVTKEDFEKLRTRPPTKEQEEETKRREKQYAEEFETELASLSGLVLIDGTFAVQRDPRGGLVLIEKFSEKPKNIEFRVSVPETEQLKRSLAVELSTNGNTRLRVFGTVTKQLTKDGAIEARAIALY